MKTIILIQGPICDNTFEIYRNYIENGFKVIVSTYSKDDEKLKKFKYDDLVLSDIPNNLGIYNRNGQRLTTNKGLKKIYSLYDECFVLKTRSDHFFKNIKDIILKFTDYLKKYPIYLDNQKSRMIIPNAGTTLTKIWGQYHVGDHWMFGNIIDVLEYYTMENVDLDKDFQFNETFSPEPEFCLKWMENKKIIETFEMLLANRFIVLDNQELNYIIVKNCDFSKCYTDWDYWNSSDIGVVTNQKWKFLNKNYGRFKM